MSGREFRLKRTADHRLHWVSSTIETSPLDIAQQPSHNPQPKGHVKYVNALTEEGIVRLTHTLHQFLQTFYDHAADCVRIHPTCSRDPSLYSSYWLKSERRKRQCGLKRMPRHRNGFKRETMPRPLNHFRKQFSLQKSLVRTTTVWAR